MVLDQNGLSPTPGHRRSLGREARLAARFRSNCTAEWSDCIVVNISPTGALLKLSYPVIALREITIVIPDDLFQATAVVRHQDGRTIGVEFTSSRREALAKYS